jgi:hypothetical protein
LEIDGARIQMHFTAKDLFGVGLKDANSLNGNILNGELVR